MFAEMSMAATAGLLVVLITAGSIFGIWAATKIFHPRS